MVLAGFPTVAGISPGQGFLSFLGQEKATQGGTNKQAVWAPFSALDWGCAVIGSLSPALPSSKWRARVWPHMSNKPPAQLISSG